MKKSMLLLAILCLLVASAASAADVRISTTITVTNATYNGNGNRIIGVGLGDGSQGESQKPLFKGSNMTLTNVRIGAPGCDGVHMFKKGTISSVTWEDVGEDAWTGKSGSGPFLVTGGTAYSAADKFGQVNSTGNATATVQNMTVDTALKVIRRNGGSSYASTLTVRNCTLKNIGEAVIRTDSKTSTLSVTGCTLTNVKCLIMIP